MTRLRGVEKSFVRILAEAEKKDVVGAKAQTALDWYRRRTLEITKGTQPENVLAMKQRWRKYINFGNMYFYQYDPKYKKTLPYYDEFPCVMVVKLVRGGFYGLNFHYLPYILRAKLLDGLMNITNNKQYNDRTKVITTYEYLKRTSSLKYFAPCFKKYLIPKITSPMIRMQAKEWSIATFLPVEDFTKRSKQYVWKESVKKIK